MLVQRLLVAAAATCFAASAWSQATFTPINVVGSQALGMSRDGVWLSGFGPGGPTYRWSAGSGYQAIVSAADGTPRVANGGSPVFSTFNDPSNGFDTAALWTSSGSTFLPGLGGHSGTSLSSAWGLSTDGSVAVGLAWINAGEAHAFKWSQATGTIDLGAQNGNSSRANAVSGDGKVVVGWDEAVSGSRLATKWDAGGPLTLTTNPSECFGVNADGSVIVGYTGSQSFRWTQASGLVVLGALSGVGGTAYADDVSDDGTTIAGGQGSGPLIFGGWHAFVWRPTIGLRKLQDVLVALGATNLTGWTLAQAIAISGDGKTIGGSGLNPANKVDSFVATLPDPATIYCTAKVNSLGCAPTIHFSGTPSASAPLGFLIGVSQELNNKSVLFFYSLNGAQASAFQGGTLCVRPPIKRTGVQNSGGNPPPNDCSGNYTIDFNSYIATGVDPALVAGAQVCGQFWARDPGFSAPNNTSLSNAISFTLWP